MILEVAILNIKPGRESAFEKAFGEAQPILAGMNGYRSHQLQRCVENSSRYILLVNWETLEDHTVGFRSSDHTVNGARCCTIFTNPFRKSSITSRCSANG